MYTLGVYLIYAAVIVRALVRLGKAENPALVVGLLALYGLVLVFATGLLPGLTRRLVRPAKPGSAVTTSQRDPSRGWMPIACLVVEAGLAPGLLLNREVQDYYALLFLPPSIQAVLWFGRRWGFACIALFTLAMAGPLLTAQEGWTFGLVMVLADGGLCFLLGGYAYQSRVAETARRRNRRTFDDLQVAHRQLQGDAAQKEELAVEKERNCLARELHDSVTQTVFSMNLTVQSARLLLGKDHERMAGQLERLEELASGAMREIQVLVSQLRPELPGPVAEGLPTALRRLADERRARDGLDVTLEVEGERTLPEQIAAGLFGIAQEALTNVSKHAGTRQAIVRLYLADGASFLEVADYGVGFDTGAAWGHRGHLGLPGMAERARELGWRLSVESHPGGGTRVTMAERAPEGHP